MKKAMLMMAAAANSSAGTGDIGKAGGRGFGVGTYPGDESELTAIGLSPMEGCYDVASDNYGNYVHTNSSVMVFIPAFCYRIGQASAPSYSRDGANALEIGAADLDGTDNWILHRAFIDGGVKKKGFFIDKYLCSKDSTGKLAVSVKNGNPICTSGSYINSSSMPDCAGQILDAITLSRARGEAYACVSAFQWSAMAMLSLAHGQAATSAEFCAWYDANHVTNFPKGNNNSLKDTNDATVTFIQASGNYGSTSLTGSASNFAKTTHNGQNSGVCDINGNKWQPLLGIMQSNGYLPAKESVKMHEYTKSNYNLASMFETAVPAGSSGNGPSFGSCYFGSGGNQAFFTEASGGKRALCGVLPKYGATGGTALFGNDYGYTYNSSGNVVLASGDYDDGTNAGLFYRYGFRNYWIYDYFNVGVRAAGYAQ